jgi:hypothetical protein
MKNLSSLDVLNYPKFYVSNNTIDVTSVTEAYSLSLPEMTQLLHRKKQQVSKIIHREKYSPEKEDIKKVFHNLIEIYTLIRALLKKPKSKKKQIELNDKIIHWFRIPNAVYRGKSPFQLIVEGKGSIVIDSLKDELYGVPL